MIDKLVQAKLEQLVEDIETLATPRAVSGLFAADILALIKRYREVEAALRTPADS